MSKALRITTDSKKSLKNEDLFVENNIVVESLGGFQYMIFCYQEIYNMYGLSAEEVLIILYLKDLWLFGLQINVVSRKYQLGSFLKRGFIVVDYTYNNKELYRLSDKGNGVINEFNNLLKNSKSYISENRETDLSQESKMNSVLDKFFK